MATVTMTRTRISCMMSSATWKNEPIKPSIMYVQEATYRGIGLDDRKGDGRYMQLVGNTLNIDFSGNGLPLQPQTVHTLNWKPYCATTTDSEGMPEWSVCPSDQYWDELGTRYATLAVEAGDTPEVSRGRLTILQLYHMSLANGISNVVKSEGQSRNSGDARNDSDLTLDYSELGLAKTAAVGIVNQVVKGWYINPTAALKTIGILNADDATQARVAGTSPDDPGKLDKLKGHWGSFRQLKGGYQGLILIAVVVVISAVIFGMIHEPDITVKVLKLTAGVVMNTVMPYLAISKWMENRAKFSSVLTGRSILTDCALAAWIGTAIVVALAWGFFIYSVLDNGIAFGSTQFDQALAGVLATTIYLVVLAIISATVVGLILVGILGLIDTFLTELGAGFTISGEAIKFLTAAIYSYDMMIEIDPSKNKNLVDTGAPAATLDQPLDGYVEGNSITVSMPVTTNIYHRQPAHSDWKVVPYLWFFDEDNFRSSTFKYSLTEKQATVDASRGSMKDEWQNVVEYDDRLMAEFYSGYANTKPNLPAVMPDAGINRQVDFFFNLGYEIPAYTCWLIPIPVFPYGVPVCYKKDEEGDNSSYVLGPRYDILPATLDEFMQPKDTGNDGIRPAWDSGFAAQWDFDGDGLTSRVKGGIDPNELTWDHDGDRLSDKYELAQREQGQSFSAIMWDTDGDKLNDAEELKNGSNPAIQDTDNDGLTDDLEVRYEKYRIENDQPVATGEWGGGWDVWIAPWEDPDTSTTPPQNRPGAIKVRVSSDPTQRDPDGDGIPDDAERLFALSSDWRNTLDPDGRPYHPNVYNTPPLQVYVKSDAVDGFVAPGQTLAFSSTVVALADFNPGVLRVDVPDVLGGGPLLYPFHLSKNMTESLRSNLTVDWSATSQTLDLSSRVRARVKPETAPAEWKFISNDQVVNPDVTTTGRALDVNWSRPDRSDGYLLSTLASSSEFQGGRGDIRVYPLPNGAASNVDNDNGNNRYLRGEAAPTTVCNDNGRCMVVWDHQDNCATVRMDWLQVIDEGDDHDTGGIEPYVLYLDDPNGGRTNWELPGSSYQIPWFWAWADMDSGAVAGPNASGFPVYRDFCNTARIRIWESDGGTSNDPSEMDWPAQEHLPGFIELRPDRFGAWKARLGPSDKSDNDNDALVDFAVTVLPQERHSIVGAFVDAGANPLISQKHLAQGVQKEKGDFFPAVASDGERFLAVWNRKYVYLNTTGTPLWNITSQIVSRLFDQDGNPVSNEQVLTQTPYVSTATQEYAADGAAFWNWDQAYRRISTDMIPNVEWTGDRYRVIWSRGELPSECDGEQ